MCQDGGNDRMRPGQALLHGILTCSFPLWTGHTTLRPDLPIRRDGARRGQQQAGPLYQGVTVGGGDRDTVSQRQPCQPQRCERRRGCNGGECEASTFTSHLMAPAVYQRAEAWV